jgi:micrococcal nuclease
MMTMKIVSSLLTLLVLALSGGSCDAFLRPAVSIAPKMAEVISNVRGGLQPAPRQQKQGATKTAMAKAKEKAAGKKEKSKINLMQTIAGFFKGLRKLILMTIAAVLFPVKFFSRPFHTRFSTVQDIPSRFFGPDAPALSGKTVKVTDGDTIRFLHRPSRFHPSSLKKGEKLSENALAIRFATIDTPEIAKFGKPGQPYGIEAKQYLERMLKDQTVKVRLLTRDQYGRAVAEVFTTGKFGGMKTYMDEAILREGMGEVYQGGGAVYGRLGRASYLEMEAKARKAKKNIWSKKKRESAAEYKKRTKE